MRCGHCGTDYHPATHRTVLGEDADEQVWQVDYETCPRCKKFNMRLVWGHAHPQAPNIMYGVNGTRVNPSKGRDAVRKPAQPEVPKVIAEDYNEACQVLSDSPKASAALSRRCLQAILRPTRREGEAPGPQQGNRRRCWRRSSSRPTWRMTSTPSAIMEISERIQSRAPVPVKSFQSSPVKRSGSSKSSSVYSDFYFVGPAEPQRKRDALNKKLADAKKPPMKKP